MLRKYRTYLIILALFNGGMMVVYNLGQLQPPTGTGPTSDMSEIASFYYSLELMFVFYGLGFLPQLVMGYHFTQRHAPTRTEILVLAGLTALLVFVCRFCYLPPYPNVVLLPLLMESSGILAGAGIRLAEMHFAQRKTPS